MTWLFQRESDRITYEIRREFTGAAFEVVITDRGNLRVEKHDSPSKLLEDSQSFWNTLIGDGWQPLEPQLWPATAE